MVQLNWASAVGAVGLSLMLGALPATGQDLLAAGRAAAMPDFPAAAGQCTPGYPRRDADNDTPYSGRFFLRGAIPTGKVFDNIVMLGTERVTAWAITTSDGIILIDALTNEVEAALAERDMKAAGLDPRDIKIIVVTHGHGDHYGGVNYFVDRYAPRVIMGTADWDLLDNPKRRIDAHWGPAPKRGEGISGESWITLGDTRILAVPTPGHTTGTLSLILPVKDKGVDRLAALWGGTGTGFGTDVPRYLGYAKGAARMRELVLDMNVEVFMSNHVNHDHGNKKLAEIQASGGKNNPYLMDKQRVARAFQSFESCARGHAEVAARGGK